MAQWRKGIRKRGGERVRARVGEKNIKSLKCPIH
jgi:hypothetical protein